MNYELFFKKLGNRDHASVCRFCLAENAVKRIDTRRIAQLFKQITNDNLEFSPNHPTYVCYVCETNLRTAVKIRNDIVQIENCWKKYIDELLTVKEVKIEELFDDSENFETVEMTIEPVDQMYTNYDDDDDWFDSDSKPGYGRKYESCSNDGGSIVNYESASDLDDNKKDITNAVRKQPSTAATRNCEHCDKKGLTGVQLRVHQQSCHPETLDAPRFQCDICPIGSKTYSSRYGIRTHMKRHMQGATEANTSLKRIERYQCSSCNERFTKKTLLVEHELRHTGGTLHVCHICGIGKRTKSLINNHLKSHNPDYNSKKNSSARAKPKTSKRYYTCWICPTRVDFKTLEELKDHRKNLHHDFQCKFCKNGFMTNEALQSHMLIHGTQDRPHLCKFCGGTFSKIGHLKSHIQGKHAEHKPYPCQKCPKGFVHRYQLESHIRIFHDKIKAFQCTECPTSFGHAKSRVWHMRTVHKK